MCKPNQFIYRLRLDDVNFSSSVYKVYKQNQFLHLLSVLQIKKKIKHKPKINVHSGQYSHGQKKSFSVKS